MKTATEISQIITLIEDIWLKNPELRLCQLIGNCFDQELQQDLYYIEDGVLQDKLINTYLKEGE